MGANQQTTVPSFTIGQVLTADQQNQSARTGVPVFADSTARDAAFGGAGEKVLAEGQLAYLEDSDVVQYYDGAAWATVGPSAGGVVQVKSTTKSDAFTTTSVTFADITGLSVSITPTSASNKILVMATVTGQQDVGTNQVFMQLVRDSTAIAVGAAAGSRTPATFGFTAQSAFQQGGVGMNFLDSPATTSAVTYKVQMRVTSNTGFVNRSEDDSDSADRNRTISSITVMEVTP